MFKTMFKAPFSFEGRIRRMEYFLSNLISGILGSIAYTLGLGNFLMGASNNSVSGFGIGVMIGFAILITSTWFSLAQGVKRLHDLDKKGWLILLFFVPLANLALGIYLLFVDSKAGPNQYGEDPKNRTPYQASSEEESK